MNMIPGSQAGRAGHALYGPPLPAPSYVSAPAHVYISASASAAVQYAPLYHPHSPTETRRPRALVSPHSAHPAARAHAWQVRLEGAHAALLADLEAIGDDEGRRRLRLEAYHDLVYRWSWEHEINPGPTGAARL
ncbi:hypothetical protein CspeluHIS016_0602530 [Cutaneotrichosporon spelunceum]|uniref:Uncharacterized protein n=1 Tax=Cutaneotrichosporon spelunceum TaxID=1672016 RepID=A0AAD3TXQ7_9TREE|nr:hypothetical protein CspeluHIS016_0602530 [Cutaneotrichosporon spelunceum]